MDSVKEQVQVALESSEQRFDAGVDGLVTTRKRGAARVVAVRCCSILKERDHSLRVRASVVPSQPSRPNAKFRSVAVSFHSVKHEAQIIQSRSGPSRISAAYVW